MYHDEPPVFPFFRHYWLMPIALAVVSAILVLLLAPAPHQSTPARSVTTSERFQ